MPISTRHINNVGSPSDDPGLLLPGNLYIPDPAVHPQPWPCVVMTVAGGFHQGAITTLAKEATDLANAGFLSLAMTVRLMTDGVLPGQTTDGKWHQQSDDLKIGIRFMRSNPGGFGYAVTGFVAALGGSGSAHHALYCALDGTVGDDKADAAICLSPPTDFSDREDDVAIDRPAIITIMTDYARVTDLPTLLARSPISLDLANAPPILHFNGANEGGGHSGMALSMLTRFAAAINATAGGANYTAITNTGLLGRQHSFAMWADGTGFTGISPIAIAWLLSKLPSIPEPPPEPPPIPGPGSGPGGSTVFNVPLQSGTLLANVRYRWIVAGIAGDELSDGITQPIADFPEFRFQVVVPAAAEEMIVYEVDNPSNWNKVEAPIQTRQFLPPPLFGVIPEIIKLRTIPFRNVVNCVLRKRGINPKGGDATRDMLASIVEAINGRVQQACLAWPWPEWTSTEERAFRQVWNPNNQYFIQNALGLPDEVFFIPNMSYYRVTGLVDPSRAIPPAENPDAWVLMDRVEPYIEYDQPCKRSIGEVLGTYQTNPATTQCWNGSLLSYRPGPHGVQIQNASGPTVFIKYKLPVPSYTMELYFSGRTYNRGDLAFEPTSGETFQAVATTQQDPFTDRVNWQFVPFLQKWMQFCCWGAYGDTLAEIDQGGVFDPQMEALKQARAEEKAMDALQQQVDSFIMQGERLTWNYRAPGVWRETLPWTGDTVTTLTDVCESSMGWVYIPY